MAWSCKDCHSVFTRRSQLLGHYKLSHGQYGRGHSYPCTYLSCACRFKTWNALRSHLARCHSSFKPQTKASAYICPVCSCSLHSTERDFFHHIFAHLKNKVCVTCVYQNCFYKTNVYENYKSHKYRKHSGKVDEFKPEIVLLTKNPEELSASVAVFSDGESSIGCNETLDDDAEQLEKDFEIKLASVLLKLESVFLVSNAAVDELLQELSYLIGSLCVPVTKNTVVQILQQNNCPFDHLLVENLASAVCDKNPVKKAIRKKGPLSSVWRRKAYYRRHFGVVEPLEYFLDKKNGKSFQYISILKTLQEILDCEAILSQTEHIQTLHKDSGEGIYKSFFDGAIFKEKVLSNEESISLILYIDDFEICNPLGTSKRKHKICGLYWTLGNLLPGCNSALSSIYLAALIKSNDLKSYSYAKVLEPLIRDLLFLEQSGLYVPKLGKTLKGTLQCVVADNLAAHGIAGFVENFTGDYICRFCTAKSSQYQTTEVNRGTFTLRDKNIHSDHLKSLEGTEISSCYGVKSNCVLSELLYFDLTKGFPPDLAHDVFEGIVPFEIALCLGVFIKKKYVTLVALNEAISSFNFKWSDKTNRPHPVAQSFASKKTVGGNAHENWSLLRFLPLLLGQSVPCEEPAWQVLLDLKDIVEIIVCPVQTEESVAYLDFKISEHRVKFQEVFTDCELKPKHHFLEHYPHLIRQYGPLVALWTMRFESKHSFFKRVARNVRCFKNVLLTLAEKHQLQMAHHLQSCKVLKPSLEVSTVTNVQTDILNKDIVSALKQKSVNVETVAFAESVTHNGLLYKCGMILVHGSLGGLPEFCEIIHMVILHNNPLFVVKKLSVWYIEHFRSYDLKCSPNKEVEVLEPKELLDRYPLVDYRIGGMRLVTLKRYIHV
nr:uncharacterized protein LOC107389155 isoform X1 [Nothobranchius furzeri]XP_054599135.1 uncharacterized protein LOC107389155 isoform X1 [Nothobranchius furzeri]